MGKRLLDWSAGSATTSISTLLFAAVRLSRALIWLSIISSAVRFLRRASQTTAAIAANGSTCVDTKAKIKRVQSGCKSVPDRRPSDLTSNLNAACIWD